MTVKEFVKQYDKNPDINVVKKAITTTYLSFVKKCNLCERIIQATHYTETPDGATRLQIDSASEYMLFNLSIVDTYTDLKIDFGNVVEEYDMLAKRDLFEIFKSVLPQRELGELYNVLELKEKDMIANEYETHAFISNQVERFGTLLGISLSPALEKLTTIVEELDAEKLAELINKVDTKKLSKLFK